MVEKQSPLTIPSPIKEASVYKDKEDAFQVRIPVLLPDMFVSFLAQKPRVNPHYERVRKESEDWINRFYRPCSNLTPLDLAKNHSKCNFDDRMKRRICGTDFSFFVSISAPEAGPEELRTMCDWGNWVRTFFDPRPKLLRFALFDNGHLRQTPEKAKQMMDNLLSIMRNEEPPHPRDPLIEVHDSVWHRVAKVRAVTSLEHTMTTDSLCRHPPSAEGVNHNLVTICRMNGMPAQQAFDHVNRLLQGCYRDWYLALADLPQWGEEIDTQVQRYIQGVQDVVLANLSWSFKSQRYLGKMHDVVRKTRQITVLPRAEDQTIMGPNGWTSGWPRMLGAKVYGVGCILVMLFASLGFSFSTMQLGFVFGIKR
ncbi:MAG: hypothetical protein Q9167_006455 [Letrouitia subvulpina]